MFHPLFKLLTALVLAYFTSRAMRRLHLRNGWRPSLLAAHALSILSILLVVGVLHSRQGTGSAGTVGYLLVGQFVWLVFDGLRASSARKRKD